MADQDVMYYSQFQGGASMKNPIVHLCPYDLWKITFKILVKTAGQVYIGALVEATETNDDYGDLEDIVIGTDESTVSQYIVLDTKDEDRFELVPQGSIRTDSIIRQKRR